MYLINKDFSDQPISVIKLPNGGYRFYPMNIEAITVFLEFEREKKTKKELNHCGAV